MIADNKFDVRGQQPMTTTWHHPVLSRRTAIQAGAISLLGLGTNHLRALREASAEVTKASAKAKSVIYIFLPGGLAQHDSFDLKPAAPDDVRGEFHPVSTASPDIQICEHLPQLAKRSNHWALVRSLTHPYNEHFEGIMAMQAGRTPLPTGFSPGNPQPTDWPSIASIAGDTTQPRNNLPPAVVLPEKLKNPARQLAPGQFAGTMGRPRDPWFVDAAPFTVISGRRIHGAFPTHSFSFEREGAVDSSHLNFEAPNLSVPEGFHDDRFRRRLDLFRLLQTQQNALEHSAATQSLDRDRERAISLLANPRVRWAFDVTRADAQTQDRYGRNSFGWSLLMARRLVEVGVNLVQVQLGNWTSWDTHASAFRILRQFLFPPMDQAVSALLDDLAESGLLDDTLIVMAGEFGRTPKISLLPQLYKLPGRDHWGGVQSVFFAGGGVRGGNVIGSSDRIGMYPDSNPQQPENLAATIYQALGIPQVATWKDELDRPHQIYHGDPIRGLV